MSYFYFNTGQEKNNTTLCAIVENSSDQQYYNDQADIVEVTTEEFLKIKSNNYTIKSYDGSNFIFSEARINPGFTSTAARQEESVRTNAQNRSEHIATWLEKNNGHAKYSEWSDYKNYLDNLDISSLLPVTKGWEEYCNDNSINFKHLLELPHQ